MSTVYKELGSTIRKYRKNKNLSTKNFAEKLGISSGHLNNIENGNYDVFKLELLTNICKQLEVPLRELLEQSFINTEITFVKYNIQNRIGNYILKPDIKPEAIEKNLDVLIMSYLITISKYKDSDKISFITEHLLNELNFIRNLNSISNSTTTTTYMDSKIDKSDI